jgi:integrase
VVLIGPDPAKRMGWRARYVDPDSGRSVRVTLEGAALQHPRADKPRRKWAVKKSMELLVRRAQLDGGASAIERNALTDAIDGYYKAAENELRETTIELYRSATKVFLEWARARSIVNTTDLKATKLPGFRDYLLAQRKRSYERTAAGRKAERAEGRDRPSPQTINWKLRAVKKVLNHLRSRGMVPLSSDQIRDALKPAPVLRQAPEFLRPTELGELLEAALRHDADTVISRDEEQRLRSEARGRGITRGAMAAIQPKGTTPRYQPIAAFVAFVLLTGMRAGEALGLRWASLDLDALDHDGHKVGEIRLRAEETKTKFARTIGLDVTPALRALLVALKLRAGKAEYVFGGAAPMAKTLAEAARRRLVSEYGAPEFSWQLLRSTCATYQCNAPGLFGDAAVFRSAKRLGHSVAVAEKHYADQYAVARDARTLETAMQIEEVLTRVIARVSGPQGQVRAVALTGVV